MPEPRRRAWAVLVPYLLLLAVGGPIAIALWDKLDSARGIDQVRWHDRHALWLVGGSALCAWVAFHLRVRRAATLSFSRVGDLAATRRGWVARLAALPAVLRVVALALIALALARPQTYKEEALEVEGIDIMVVLDLSKSMEERDLLRNRLDAGQRVIREFVKFLGKEGGNDRVGLVVFAREAMMQCPLTLDYRSFDQIVADLGIGDVPEMGTAIGDGLGLALASLRRSDARSKVVILLSDGDENYSTEMEAAEAKQIAADMKVKVFTVLMGREEGRRRFGRDQYAVNPALLREIAAATGGIYSNAADSAELEASFKSIRQNLSLTRRRVLGRVPDAELFPQFLYPAAILLLFEIGLGLTRWRRFP